MAQVEVLQPTHTLGLPRRFLNVQILKTRPPPIDSDAVELGWGLRNCLQGPAGSCEHSQMRAVLQALEHWGKGSGLRLIQVCHCVDDF